MSSEVTPPASFTDSNHAIYQEYFPMLDKVMWAREINIDRDLDTIHDWMNRDHVKSFWNMAWPIEKIRQYLLEAKAKENFDCYIAFMGDEPMVYFELYHPGSDPVGKTYDIQEGDLGLHVLIGDEKYMRRYIIRLSTMMMRLVFNHHPETLRVIGEPDVNNKQIQSVMKFVGFKWIADVQLPDKTGALHTLNIEDFNKLHGQKPKKKKPV